MYGSYLRGKKREMNILIEDFDEKSDKLKGKEGLIKDVQNKLDSLSPKLSAVKKDILKKRDSIKDFEEKIKRVNELKKNIDIKGVELENKLSRIQNINENLEELNNYIKELNNELKGNDAVDLKKIREEISLKEKEIKVLEETIKGVSSKLNELKVKKEHSENVKGNVSKLNVCPVCKQNVSKEHKHSILSEEEKKLIEYESNIKLFSKNYNDAELRLRIIKEDLDKLRKEEYNTGLKNIRASSLKEKEEGKNKLLKQLDELKKGIGKINLEKRDLFNDVEKFIDVEKDYNKFRAELDELMDNEKIIEVERAGLEKEFIGYKKERDELEKEINTKLKVKNKLEKINEMHHWLEEHFINLMDVIEKNVMLRIHSDFDKPRAIFCWNPVCI